MRRIVRQANALDSPCASPNPGRLTTHTISAQRQKHQPPRRPRLTHHFRTRLSAGTRDASPPHHALLSQEAADDLNHNVFASPPAGQICGGSSPASRSFVLAALRQDDREVSRDRHPARRGGRAVRHCPGLCRQRLPRRRRARPSCPPVSGWVPPGWAVST